MCRRWPQRLQFEKPHRRPSDFLEEWPARRRAKCPTNDRPNYSFRDGVLEIRGGGGWLRTPRPFLNFRVTFDFKATSPDADPGVFVRSWVSPQRGADWRARGYRVRLPISPAPPSALVVGHERKVSMIEEGRLVVSPDEWQPVEITAEGARVRVTLNGVHAAVFEVEDFGGYIMFNNRDGRAQFRDIRITSTERGAEIPADLTTVEQHKKSGGKAPKLIREVRPNYTMDAMREKVQGAVSMQVVVLPDGSVGPVRVTRSLHRDLDLSAARLFARGDLHRRCSRTKRWQCLLKSKCRSG